MENINELDNIRQEKERILAQEMILLEKGLRSSNPDEFLKAQRYLAEIEKRTEENGKAYIVDPNQINQSFGYKHKFTNFSYDLLRRMARVPLIFSVITTKVDRIAEFAVPQTNKYSPGFVIKQRRTSFSNDVPKEPATAIKKLIDEATFFLLNCGKQSNVFGGDTFESFIRKVSKDSLELDQLAFEVVRTKKGEIDHFIAIDAATIRIADSLSDSDYEKYNKKANKEEINGYYPSYVQLRDNVPFAEFYPWELCFGIRNENTNIYSNGYGTSELEILINVVTSLLNGEAYNANNFLNGSFPKGVFLMPQGTNSQKLADFRNQWNAMLRGVNNAHNTMTLEGKDIEWIDMQKSNSDMEFSSWIQFLIKIICAVYKTTPEDIGFSSQSGGNSLFESNNETKLQHSKDKGLKPMLRFLQNLINKFIIYQRYPELEFEFVGIDTDSEKDELDMDLRKAGVFMTLKEIRRKYNLPEDIDDSDLLLNNIWMQNKQMSNQNNPNDMEQIDSQPEDDSVNKGIDVIESDFDKWYNTIINK